MHASKVICIAGRMRDITLMTRKRRQRTDYVTCRHCRKEFRAINVFHLRLHDYDGDHPINEYKQKYGLRTAMCADVRKKISEAKEDFWAKRGQHWTHATLIAEIRRLHRGGRSLRRERVPVRLYEAGRRFFGTWQAAIEKAGFKYEEATGIRHWTPAKVVEGIKELAERGVPLAASYVEAKHPTLFNVAIKRFPNSWAKALQAAGFDPEEHKMPRGRWDRQRAADWVQKRAAKGRSLLAGAAPPDLLGFVYRHISTSWGEFVESLGLPFPGIRKRRDWT
jgi:hypothetical protein